MGRITACLLFLLSVTTGAHAGPPELYGTLEKISQANAVRMGYRESSYPFSFLDQTGRPIGYTIDLCMRIVEAIEQELGVEELEIQMVTVDPQTRIPLLVGGDIDIECGSTTNSLFRQEEVDFSHTTFITGTKLLVEKESGIWEIEDLDGRPIAVARGTTNERAIEALAEAKGLDLEIVSVADHAEGFAALEAGRSEAYATDHILLHGLLSQADAPEDYAVVGRFLSYDPYAIMVRRDDSAFRLVVNRALSELFRSGEIFEIYRQWFDPMAMPTTELLEAAFLIQALPE